MRKGNMKSYATNFTKQNQLTNSSSKKQSIVNSSKLDLTKLSLLDFFKNSKHFNKLQLL